MTKDQQEMVAQSRAWVSEIEIRHLNELYSERNRPFHHMKPKLYIDGDQWCCLFGENLQDGICGFGASPAAAAYAFDVAFHAKLPTKEEAIS